MIFVNSFHLLGINFDANNILPMVSYAPPVHGAMNIPYDKPYTFLLHYLTVLMQRYIWFSGGMVVWCDGGVDVGGCFVMMHINTKYSTLRSRTQMCYKLSCKIAVSKISLDK